MRVMWILAGFLLYMEAIYHLGCFGLTLFNPGMMIGLILVTASLQALLIGKVRRKNKKTAFWITEAVIYLLYASQLVYFSIFKQPLMWEAAYRGGGDALTNYWREALEGILKALPFLILLAVPMIVSGLVMYRGVRHNPKGRRINGIRYLLTAGAGIVLCTAFILTGKAADADYYEEYSEFYDPLSVAQNMGALTLVQRDTAVSIGSLTGSVWNGLFAKSENALSEKIEAVAQEAASREDDHAGETGKLPDEGQAAEATEPEEEQPDTSPHQLPIDFASLKAGSGTNDTAWLAEYIENLTPTDKNEYTGLFEGYNLIYLTGEGFSPYAVREDLTPTLYRLVNSGFVFRNYYTPLWQTSTSDGEYINCTALIPDAQFSMRKSGSNDMAFTLPRYFVRDGVGCAAYHDNSLSYYDRNVTHNNLGYVFKAARTGDLDEAEWGKYIFPMEHPGAWPASDLEMMKGTIPEYVNEDRFHVYYMTVSGHMNYNFKGNAMSAKNREAVEHLQMSENARAYIACHIELDKALEYLLQQLEEAGQLEKTVICLSADHYPYGMTLEEYEELAGKPLGDNLDLYRNNLILWNAGMEENPVYVDKVCGSMDIVPTLLNLFGFEYDSRLYAGRDIFADGEGLVIFNDRSFVTDTVINVRKAKDFAWKPEPAEDPADAGRRIVPGEFHYLADDVAKDEYIKGVKQDVKDRYQFSAFMLQNDYYHNIMNALPEQYHNTAENPAVNWKPAPPITQPEPEQPAEQGTEQPQS